VDPFTADEALWEFENLFCVIGPDSRGLGRLFIKVPTLKEDGPETQTDVLQTPGEVGHKQFSTKREVLLLLARETFAEAGAAAERSKSRSAGRWPGSRRHEANQDVREAPVALANAAGDLIESAS